MVVTEDRVLRAMTDDASFRVMTAITTNTVAEVMKRQNPPSDEMARLGDLLTGTILIRETMSPNLRVQGILRGAGGKGTLVADSHPDGTARGLVSLPQGMTSLPAGSGATLMMMRTLPNGKLHQGMVSYDSNANVSEALMRYMQESEQIKTMIDVACVVEQEQVVAAGGFIVQLLPELTESQLAIMTERLSDFPPMGKLLRNEATASQVLDELLYAMPNTRLGDSPLRFDCKCSQTRVVASLATLDRNELGNLLTDGHPIEICCDFCGKEYAITAEQVRGLLRES
ncbi:MAG TPA: Hsp33 family molecular chaperone HslO [Polyangiaceae bacterium]|nr:MAG: 33 kDa chaperonin [Deltaproteobacteria bacterium ADurb.Bin207]HOD25310.1 Hsp33 family molecular chaperone HslO [Polyangiaceae bacterium]HPB95603.1 Hsp33 family molecular chaperone HslO [Polyangiaceae bacterium]